MATRSRAAAAAAAALLILSPPAALAQTYSTICGPATLYFPNATLPAGNHQRLVRCGYTLAGSATFLQSFTLVNPQSALLKLVSARDTNCEQPYLSVAPASDNALGYTTSSTTLAMTGQPQAATGDSTGEPRVCIYVSCVSGTCATSGLALSNYYGKRQTAPASGGSSSGGGGSAPVGGVVGGIVVLVCLLVACSWIWRCQRQQRMALEMQRQAQMQQMQTAHQPHMQAFQPQPMVMGAQVRGHRGGA